MKLETRGLRAAPGSREILHGIDLAAREGQFVGIIGPNGSGKSTLMKIIAGWVQPDSGTVTIGQTVKIGYFSQENEAMDESQRVIDYIKDVAEYVPTSDGRITASQMLERFLFPSSVQYNVIAKLSGGEKRRLYLCRILMEAPNVLMLDEPTNDLDIQTLTILEDYLDHFQGIVIAVSHDRYFLDRTVRRIFAFEGNGVICQYEGGFTDYQAAYERIHGEEQPETRKEARPAGEKSKEKPREKKLKFTYMEQKEWETIEETIASLEEETAALEKEIEAAATDYAKLKELMARKEEKEALLEEKMDRWMYLNDLAEKIAAQQS